MLNKKLVNGLLSSSLVISEKLDIIFLLLLYVNTFVVLYDDLISEIEFKENYKGFKGVIDLFHIFYGIKFDAVLDLHDVIRTKVLKLLFKMVGTPIITFEKVYVDYE